MQAKPTVFQGVATAMVTPFTAEGGLNLKTFDQLIDRQIAAGTNALVVCGSTGEPSTMDISEEAVLLSHTVERVNKRIPIIMGAGSNDTGFAVRSVKQAAQLGADALLVVTPYYNKTTQEGLYRHYMTVADAACLPIIVYNVPSRTNLNLLPATLERIAQHPNIVAVKEASGDLAQVAEVALRCPELSIYSGNDDIVVPVLSVGGKGVISVVSNLMPERTGEMVASWFAGDVKKAAAIQLELLPLVKALFCEVNPIPVKTALRDLGFGCGPLRLPLIDMAQHNHDELNAQMRALGLLA